MLSRRSTTPMPQSDDQGGGDEDDENPWVEIIKIGEAGD